MKRKFIQTQSLYIMLGLFLIFSTSLQAQIPGFQDDVNDQTPAAPIDGLLGLGLAVGTIFAYKNLKKK